MKTKTSPKLIQAISDDTVLLWFEKPNKYVVTSNIHSQLITLYMNPDENRDSFVNHTQERFNLNQPEAIALFDDITQFLNEASLNQEHHSNVVAEFTPPKTSITQSYQFKDTIVNISFESEIIKSLIHPQIAHHRISTTDECEVHFNVFRSSDDLYLFKDGKQVGCYQTEAFHFLQGKFALELTNTIHNTIMDNWIATFHASTVSNGKTSIMIIGDSGNGKSTLSVLLMAHGYDILCDDFTPLYEDNLHLYRYPAATSIKKGAFEALKPYLNGIDLLQTHTNGPKKVNIKYVPPLLSYDKQEASFPCHTIVYVKYNSEKQDRLELVSADKILQTLIPDSWISPKESHALAFMNWFKNTRCYELNYSSNVFAVSKFKSLFEES